MCVHTYISVCVCVFLRIYICVCGVVWCGVVWRHLVLSCVDCYPHFSTSWGGGTGWSEYQVECPDWMVEETSFVRILGAGLQHPKFSLVLWRSAPHPSCSRIPHGPCVVSHPFSPPSHYPRVQSENGDLRVQVSLCITPDGSFQQEWTMQLQLRPCSTSYMHLPFQWK